VGAACAEGVIISIPPGGSRGSTSVEDGFLEVLLPLRDPDFDSESVSLALLVLLRLASPVAEGSDVTESLAPVVSEEGAVDESPPLALEGLFDVASAGVSCRRMKPPSRLESSHDDAVASDMNARKKQREKT